MPETYRNETLYNLYSAGHEFKTKREAVESFERLLDVLRDATAGRI